MSRTGRAAKGFVTSIFQFISQIVVQALLAPIVLRMAGRETLGAYSAVMQILGFIALTDFIGSWTLERFLGQASGLDDGGERFRCVFTTVRTMYLFSVSAYSVLVVIFSFFVGPLFHLSPGVAHQAKYALWVIAIWVIVRMPFAAYQNASFAMQDMAAVNLIGTCTGIARSLASLVFVLLGGGLFGLMLSGTIVEGFGYLFYRMRFKKRNPDLMPSWGIPDKALLREMLGFGGHAFVVNLGSGLVFGSGNMIAGLTHGAAEASTFYTTQMPTMTAYNMTMRLSDSAMPAINELWGRRDVEKLRNAQAAPAAHARLLLAFTLPPRHRAWLFVQSRSGHHLGRPKTVCWKPADRISSWLLHYRFHPAGSHCLFVHFRLDAPAYYNCVNTGNCQLRLGVLSRQTIGAWRYYACIADCGPAANRHPVAPYRPFS